MSNFVLVREGLYRGEEIRDTVFPLVQPAKTGKKGIFVTVDATKQYGSNRIRVRVPCMNSIEYINEESEAAEAAEPAKVETDEEALDRIRKRFSILDQMSDAVAKGIVRGLIISGPPGVGKSFGVENVLREYEAMHKLSGGRHEQTEIVKGSMTPIGLYQTLYNNSEKGNILVFDDCDSILFDEVCLNMLKAVLDSGKKRTISWKAESAALRREGIPDRFDFEGGVIFITNLDFENVRSKKIADHLEALMSRCHYIDLEMDSERDRFLRIEQIVRDGMLDEYGFGDDGNKELIGFMKDNAKRLREISLRMVLKIADLKAMSNDDWQELAKSTCMKRLG